MNALLLAALLALPAAPADYSDADVAVLVQQSLLADARQQGLSADALGRSVGMRPDLDVATDVREVLKLRVGPQVAGLTVTCQHGEVVLRGRADSAETAAHAVLLAQAVPGARKVVDRFVVPGAEAQAAYSAPVDKGPGLAGPFAFVTHNGFGASNVIVRVEGGTVRVTGLASSAAARDHVTTSARLVPGARVVQNEMTLYAGDRAEDERLQQMIARRLEWSVDLRPVIDRLTVSVTQGVVTLKGSVATPEQAAEAAGLAASTRGIVVVDDRITVGG